MSGLSVLLSAGALVAPAFLFGQSFAAASIKPTAPGSAEFPFARIEVQAGGRLTAFNATLRDLIIEAYQLRLRNYMLEGGPEWLATDRFEVSAAAGTAANHQQVMRMLQMLLGERFGLQVRTVTRELPMFELRLARSDGRLGPQLKPSARDCGAVIGVRSLMDASTLEGDDAPCQFTSMMRAGAAGATRRWARAGIRMSQLATMLTTGAGRVVVDRTGLGGTYDFDLTYSPEGVRAIVAGGGPPIDFAPPADGMSLQSAIQEQLGLKLVSARGPVDVLVIDSAERPAAN